ncbi:MAG: hypothetical protein Q9M23_04310, partial [Mariprofundaceae bacterium]|nr:hypothetical protein [Mariprofundaceae bacterium]
SRLSGNAALEARAAEIPKVFARDMNRAPSGFIWLLTAMQQAQAGGADIVLAGDSNKPDMQAMRDALNKRYIPENNVLLANQTLTHIAPFTSGYSPLDGQATAYVCRNGQCSPPTTEIKQMIDLLNEK